MRLRIGALVWYPIPKRGLRSAGCGWSSWKRHWGFRMGQLHVITIVVSTDAFKANPEWKLS
jgi:hypothetical protein